MNMSERELRVYRDTLIAVMGQIMSTIYGDEAIDVLANWLHQRIKERWKQIAKETGRSDPEIFLNMFNPEAHEYEVIRKSKRVLEVKVKKCIHAEVFRKLNASQIGLKLICSGDEAATEGYNPKIKLRRPEILMRGDSSCHFIWELIED